MHSIHIRNALTYTNFNFGCVFKVARAQKIGLKSTYHKKYDLGKSLSKEM